MSLIKSTIKNISLVYISVGFTKILGLLSTIILARLLMPADFGIFGLASSVIGLMAVFGNIQIGVALILRKDRVKEASDTVFIIDLLIGLILFITGIIIAPYASQFYNEKAIYLVVIVLSFVFIIDSFSSVPLALLNKSLKFKKLTFIEIFVGALVVLVTVALAFWGYSYWSLLIGSAAGSVANVLLAWALCSWRPRFTFNKQIAKEMFKFSFYLFFSAILVFFILSIDTFIIGKFFGLATLGYYAMAFKFGNYSTTLVTHVIGKVLFPTFSLIQDDIEKLKNAYLKTLKYVSLISIPIAFGTYILSKEFVMLILGEKWQPAIVLLQILCFYGLFRALGAGAGNVFIALGKPQISTKILILQLLFALLLIYPLAINFGATGIGLAMTISFLIQLILAYYYINKLLNLFFINQLELIIIPLISSILMLILVDKLKEILLLTYFNLLVILLSGLLVYLIGIYIFSKGKIYVELRELLKYTFRS